MSAVERICLDRTFVSEFTALYEIVKRKRKKRERKRKKIFKLSLSID